MNKYNLSIISGIVMLVFMLASCSTTPLKWGSSLNADIDSTLNSVTAENGLEKNLMLPPEINDILLPPLELGSSEEGSMLIEPRFDLAAHKTPARTVFMSLVKDTPYSMVMHPKVGGVISLQLKDVTVDEAMDAIRRIYGYEYKKEGDRYFIYGQGLQTRMYPVNYLNLNRKGRSNMSVTPSGLIQSVNSEGGVSTQGNGIEVETSTEYDFWKDIKAGLEGLIGTDEGRRIVTNPQAGLVIVRAMPSELDIVQEFLGITQTSVNRQVILEAKIIEVELNDGFQAGINWSGLGSSGSTDYLISQVGGGTMLNGSNASLLAGQTANLEPDGSYSPFSSGITSAFGGVFSMAIKAPDFSAFVEMLQTQGDVQVLSSPRVSTVNNQKAVIKVGGDEFFVTGISNNQTTTGSTTTITPDIELTPFFSGIALDVTPQIDNDGNIILHIHPTVSNVSQKDKSFVVSGESFSLPLAFSTIQESDNVVRAQSGQVIIIGGLMKEAVTEANASVPVLGDIPVLGNLFKHQKMTRIKKELVILLKPSVVDIAGTWNDAIQASHDRTHDLGRMAFSSD